ncbi:CAP domain-containing protein [Cadophora sp. MPI-SDFR-AT-0126]|nr:CAP domain-containing protein [Leotiomycetes sp. MPI-SDFR-AT-0126]
MANKNQQRHWLELLNGRSLLFFLLSASRTVAHNDTCTVLGVFEPITLQNREPLDLSFADNTRFQTQVVDDHNFFQVQHGSNPLSWSDRLAKSSSDWIDKCRFEHSKTPGVSENLALGYSRVLDAINAWALERVEYNFDSPGFGMTTSHFTQMVWKGTTEVGCAKKQCRERSLLRNIDMANKEKEIQDFADGRPSWYVVCQYQSPGNVNSPGFFEENVGRQTSGDPKAGIPSTLSNTSPRTSASPIQATAPVAAIPPKTVTVGAPDIFPEVVVITVTVTEGDAPPEASFSAATGKTAAAPISTSCPFWGRLKSSGTTMDKPFFMY